MKFCWNTINVEGRTVISHILTFAFIAIAALASIVAIDAYTSAKLTDIDFQSPINIEAKLPKDLLADINKNRPFIGDGEEKPMSEFERKYLYDYDIVPESLKYAEGTAGEGTSISMPASIEKQLAIDDIEYLFACLKYGYAGYKIFGGDEVFSKAKQNIINSIDNFKGNVPVSYLEDAIYKSLDFIQDGHFSIGKNVLVKKYNMYTSEKYEIAKEDGIYYLIDNGDTKHIVSIENEDPGNYIKPSIDKNGYPLYRLCALRQSQDKELIVQINLENAGFKASLSNAALNYKNNKNTGIYSLKKYHNVPFVKIASFIPSPELEDFVEDAKYLKDESLLIIDLRGNTGGNSMYATNWVENYTNTKIEAPFFSAALTTDLALNALLHTIKSIYGENYHLETENAIRYQYDSKSTKFSIWNEFYYNIAKRISNEKPIFILIDMKVGSAAEMFLSMLSYLENTYIVGTNSSGSGDIGNAADYMLPNSGIMATFGSLLNISPDLQMRDGLGFQPDFWVASEDMEKRVIRFIKNYSRKQ